MGCSPSKPNIQTPKPIHRTLLDSDPRQNSVLHDTKEISHLDQTTIISNISTNIAPPSSNLTSSSPNTLPKITVTPYHLNDTSSLLKTPQKISQIIIDPPKIIQLKVQDMNEVNSEKSSSKNEIELCKQIEDQNCSYEEEDSIIRDYLSLIQIERPKKHVKSLSQQLPIKSYISELSKSAQEENFNPYSVRITKVKIYIG